MAVGRAPAKVILFGEHAVVYGQPAIAVPVTELYTEVAVEPGVPRQGVLIHAHDLGRHFYLSEAPDDDPIRLTIVNAFGRLDVGATPDLSISIRSTIPIARGLGSGAALATALVRALAQQFGVFLSSREISDLAYATETLHHGTPSGIDNTVIAFGKPVYFVRGQELEVFWVRQPFTLVVADTGVVSETRQVVADVRRAWEADGPRYDAWFDEIGQIARDARRAIEQGQVDGLGPLMDRNHALLQAVGVSCPSLDRLVQAARDGGALGAKLCGAGRGGNMVALVEGRGVDHVSMMLRLAGACHVVVTTVR
ncbi:MAG: mevalonate kinase [Chloroflexi bacterium]|nr:mevalonate kinase [Chloroflexota bacterium]